MQEHEDHVFLYVEVCGGSPAGVSLLRNYIGKSGGISRITCTGSIGENNAYPCNSSCKMIALIKTTEAFVGVRNAISDIQRSTVARSMDVCINVRKYFLHKAPK